MYYSSKTLGYDKGYSCVFRQKDAYHSHCSLWHGYALGFKFTWRSPVLDECNWVFDYGGISEFKPWLDWMFDHTFIVATDDPYRFEINKLDRLGACDLRYVDASGCEKFAELVFNKFNTYFKAAKLDQEILLDIITLKPPKKRIGSTVELYSVEVSEHTGNSAKYCIE